MKNYIEFFYPLLHIHNYLVEKRLILQRNSQITSSLELIRFMGRIISGWMHTKVDIIFQDGSSMLALMMNYIRMQRRVKSRRNTITIGLWNKSQMMFALYRGSFTNLT